MSRGLLRRRPDDHGVQQQVGCILTKSDFHRLVTCLVVCTLRSKSLMMCAFLFMGMSQINGISIWQGPHTLYL